jgi:hypothetical protein
MDLKETKVDGVEEIDQGEVSDRWRALVNTAMNLWEPYKAEKCTD